MKCPSLVRIRQGPTDQTRTEKPDSEGVLHIKHWPRNVEYQKVRKTQPNIIRQYICVICVQGGAKIFDVLYLFDIKI